MKFAKNRAGEPNGMSPFLRLEGFDTGICVQCLTFGGLGELCTTCMCIICKELTGLGIKKEEEKCEDPKCCSIYLNINIKRTDGICKKCGVQDSYMSKCNVCDNSVLAMTDAKFSITDGRCPDCLMFGDALEICEYCDDDLENYYVPIIQEDYDMAVIAKQLFAKDKHRDTDDDDKKLPSEDIDLKNDDSKKRKMNENYSQYDSSTDSSTKNTDRIPTMFPLIVIRYMREIICLDKKEKELRSFFNLVYTYLPENYPDERKCSVYLDNKGTLETPKRKLYVNLRLSIMRSCDIVSVQTLMIHSSKFILRNFRYPLHTVIIEKSEHNLILCIGTYWLQELNKMKRWNIYTDKDDISVSEDSIITI